MATPDSTPAYAARKPPLTLVATAAAFAIGIAATVKYHYYWLTAILLVLYLLGITHTIISVWVTATDVFVRSLARTQRYALHEITDVQLEEGVAPVLRLIFPLELVKIQGFSSVQVRNLRNAILAARDHAAQQT
jgi:hypothetical protein